MKVLAIIGTSNTGKTTTLEYLVSNLVKKGFRIGSAKHVHHPNFTIDLEGKDTWRHTKAGASRVVCLSEDEVAVMRKENGGAYTLEDILRLFKDEKFDLIILEGFHELVSNNKKIWKIVTAKDLEDVEKRLDETVSPIFAITGKISNIIRRKSIREIPVIDLKNEGVRLLNIITEQIIKT